MTNDAIAPSTIPIKASRKVLAAETPLIRQQGDSALRRPRREPTEAMKEHLRKEKARLEDAAAFRARICVETIDDWMEKNADSYEWENQFDFAAPTVLISSKLNQQLPSNPVEYWNELRTSYPDLIAIDEASRVGLQSCANSGCCSCRFRHRFWWWRGRVRAAREAKR
jgi:hypothetical protein